MVAARERCSYLVCEEDKANGFYGQGLTMPESLDLVLSIDQEPQATATLVRLLLFLQKIPDYPTSCRRTQRRRVEPHVWLTVRHNVYVQSSQLDESVFREADSLSCTRLALRSTSVRLLTGSTCNICA
mmetsp:Transcript_11264/g.41245  ORF Transcript_11264/g.41245 Transcript_11264/m.41245 type:complete len:128 (-) Transcript_11264:23-406(-)